MDLKIGLQGTKTATVERSNTAAAVGSGMLEVFATPSMIALMECAAAECAAPCLETGCGTVGTLLEVRHISATPIGLTVCAEAELIEIDGKRLVFRVAAYDDSGLIGEGRHERFVINNERFMEKASRKRADS